MTGRSADGKDLGTYTCPEGTGPDADDRSHRLAYPLQVERVYTPDGKAMRAALRVVLGPRLVPAAGERGETNDGEDEGGSPVPASL